MVLTGSASATVLTSRQRCRTASGAAQLDRAASEVRSEVNEATTRSHPYYGTCSGCRQLKHVSRHGVIHDHNRYRATGTVIVQLRCAGSGERYLESTAPTG